MFKKFAVAVVTTAVASAIVKAILSAFHKES